MQSGDKLKVYSLKLKVMANNYNMDLVVRGSKKSLDEMQGILQQEIDEGQTDADYYTVHRSLKRMGYDPEKIECRAYMEELQRRDDGCLCVRYVGAWSPQYGLLRRLRQRWPDITITWQGIDEFGQYPETNDPSLVGKWKIEDEEEGLNPFCELDEWVGDEALPVINRYYGTDCQSMEQAFESIERLCHSDRMQFCEEC